MSPTGHMARPTVAVITLVQLGHFRRLRPVIQGLVGRGADVVVCTARRFAPEVERLGGRFVDLFEGRPFEGLDDETLPWAARWTTWAARYAGEVSEQVADAELVVGDSSSVIAEVVARALRVPFASVRTGHAWLPETYLPTLAQQTVRISAACEAAAGVLRDRYGMEDATPFAYASGPSRDLNVYCEPPEFLNDAERARFEPVVFIGSLAPGESAEPSAGSRPGWFPSRASRRVYVSFGTFVWTYWTEEALLAMGRVAEAISRLPGAAGLISLGGADIPQAAVDALRGPQVRVERFVDQWSVLEETDVFVTHHGLNSTHEAVWHTVPMVSYPFFADQPLQAARCQELGLAVGLVDEPRAAPTVEDVLAAIARVDSERDRFASALEKARGWEEATIAGRPHVVDRILELAG